MRIVEVAREFIGTPWKHMGRTGTGIDCVGLVVTVGKMLGLHEYPDDIQYSRQSVGSDLIKPFAQFAERIKNLTGLKDGDVLIMKDAFFPHNVGFMASNGDMKTIIHACVHRGKVVEDTYTEDFKKRLITAFKFKGLD